MTSHLNATELQLSNSKRRKHKSPLSTKSTITKGTAQVIKAVNQCKGNKAQSDPRLTCQDGAIARRDGHKIEGMQQHAKQLSCAK